MKSRTRICLLGGGRMGATHAENIYLHPDAVLHVLGDVREQTAQTVAARLGSRGTTDIAAAITDPEVEAVVIATSTDTHAELIEAVARTGRPIFCEKPIDLALDRVDACSAAVESAGVALQIGFNRRFDPHFRELHDRLRAGAVGELEVVKITSRDPAPPPIAYVEVSGGLFRDMMIHDFDMARWLLGEEPVSVHATGSCLVDPAIGEAGDIDTAVVTMRTARGAICTIENSRRAVYGYDQRVEVLGDRGMLQAGNPTPTTVVQAGADLVAGDKPFWFALDRYREAYRAELDHFLSVVRDAVTPSVGMADGRAALALAEAALESLSTGRTVELG